MAGASITISVLALAAANTLGIQVDLLTALLLCLISTVGACGASGVAGGSLLLIPVACASFGISNDLAMQVVALDSSSPFWKMLVKQPLTAAVMSYLRQRLSLRNGPSAVN